MSLPVPGRRLQVLLLEDSAADAELLLYELRRAGMVFDAQRVETESAYLAHLDPAPDLILSDYQLPQFDTLRALELLHEHELDIPLIIVSGVIREEVAVECMKRGAADFLMKDRLGRLGPAVLHALEQHRLREERRLAHALLREREASFRLLFAINPQPLLVYDRATLQILAANRAASAAYGYAEAELLALTLTDLEADANDVEAFRMVDIDDGGWTCSGAARHRLRDGRIVDVQTTVQPVELAGRPAVLLVSNLAGPAPMTPHPAERNGSANRTSGHPAPAPSTDPESGAAVAPLPCQR